MAAGVFLGANQADSSDNFGFQSAHPSWKPNRYVSKSRERLINELKKGRSSHKTFGLPRHAGVLTGVAPPFPPAKPVQPQPDDAGEASKTRCSCEQRRPPVPRPWERPTQYPPTHNNYVRYNVKHVDESADYHEMRHEPRLVDARDGHAINLKNSGLVPQFVTKPNFGKLPAYLKPSEQAKEPSQPGATVTIMTPKQEPSTHKEAKPNHKEEILVLQKKWIELDQRMGVVSFSRPDKREAIEDELLAIERRLQSLTATGAV